MVSSAVNMIAENSVVVIRANDSFNSYYLVKIIDKPYKLKENTTDSYGHLFYSDMSVVKGNYFEILFILFYILFIFIYITKTYYFLLDEYRKI